ncbi:MAG: hypothetical protein JNM33_09090 [Rubrivivax sp.]|nr:hypothetical protein [Rubrivivax sp.]
MIAIPLPRCLWRPFRRPRAEAAARPPAPTAEDRFLGCGWFDSSHDLQRGLRVREHDSPDAVAAELPLATWLDWHMAGHTLTGQQQGGAAMQA